MKEPSKERVWIDIDGRVDTLKGHCRQRGLIYNTLIGQARQKFGGITNMNNEQLSRLMGLPVVRAKRPSNTKNLLNYRGDYRTVDAKVMPYAERIPKAVTAFLSMRPPAFTTYPQFYY